MSLRTRHAVDPHVVVAEVVATRRVSPSMVRVTFGGEGIGLFTATGADQWFRLFLPREGQDVLRLPTRTSALWYVQYLATPRHLRPWIRAYTVRAARPEQAEIDVDFVVHLHDGQPTGPAVRFALEAQPGDRVGILDQGVTFTPHHDGSVLLVADETGLPAVAGICASLPSGARGLALVEVPSAADVQPVAAPPGVEVRWLTRDQDGDVPGRLALRELCTATLPTGPVRAYAVGEQALATGARRHLVGERGLHKKQVTFAGYWRHGHAAQ
ncbi:siderophore-interacting protein [Cellulomonas bogoriensis]|uniref:Iron utilization protein n=1 Tax=Cellulomonas bogoriensis 69B4 = DSM 16987 TaxID=1386082 RepID=A0A0A0BY74_9CELL|nr:siderophore-interacting protein [Cellulomonas bogoriensis]KGM12866.1 iron utilization protein [Cellulomonas bogoriensis 69B4 = DSM 16987]